MNIESRKMTSDCKCIDKLKTYKNKQNVLTGSECPVRLLKKYQGGPLPNKVTWWWHAT